MSVISPKAEFNIGLVGHVANGKSTIAKFFTHQNTNVHSAEADRGITMRMNYGSTLICKDPKKTIPDCFFTKRSDDIKFESPWGTIGEPLMRFDLVDCPGHKAYMQFMFNGAWVMDGAIIVMSAEHKEMPAIQTIEHASVLKAMNIPVLAVVINKCDQIKRENIFGLIEIAEEFMLKMGFPPVPIIPTCANRGVNLDILCDLISKFPIPTKSLTHDPMMVCVRSFGINTQCTDLRKLKGGIIGGTVIQGMFSLNDDITIFPGIISVNSNKDTKWKYSPIKSKIVSMRADTQNIDKADPGGLIAFGTNLDPSIANQDRMVGTLIVNSNKKTKPHIYESIIVTEFGLGKFSDMKEVTSVTLEKDDRITVNSKALQITGTVLAVVREKDEVNDDLLKIKNEILGKDGVDDSDDDTDSDSDDDQDSNPIVFVSIDLNSQPLCLGEFGHVSISKNVGHRDNVLVGHGTVYTGKESIMISI